MDHSPNHIHTWPSYFPPPPLQLLSDHHVAVFLQWEPTCRGEKMSRKHHSSRKVTAWSHSPPRSAPSWLLSSVIPTLRR
jgi:hypothetical protein